VYVSRYAGAGGANGECEAGKYTVDSYLAVDWQEPMLNALQKKPGVVCEPGDTYSPLTCLSDPGRARAYVTRNFLVSRLGYSREDMPAKFCAYLNGWKPLEIAAVVDELPGDSGDQYEFVISHAVHSQAWQQTGITGVAEGYQKAAVYLDMRRFEAFETFAKEFRAKSGARVVPEEGGDRIRAGIDMSRRLEDFVQAAMLAFLAISAFMSGYTVGGQLRAQRKAVTVLRIFGLSRIDLALYFLIQVFLVQIFTLTVFALLFAGGIAIAWAWFPAAATLIGSMDLSWKTLVGLAAAVVLIPTFVAFAWSFGALRLSERKMSFANILKQTE
jgi:hypothetical protein